MIEPNEPKSFQTASAKIAAIRKCEISLNEADFEEKKYRELHDKARDEWFRLQLLLVRLESAPIKKNSN